jgi:hypothetical protein
MGALKRGRHLARQAYDTDGDQGRVPQALTKDRGLLVECDAKLTAPYTEVAGLGGLGIFTVAEICDKTLDSNSTPALGASWNSNVHAMMLR